MNLIKKYKQLFLIQNVKLYMRINTLSLVCANQNNFNSSPVGKNRTAKQNHNNGCDVFCPSFTALKKSIFKDIDFAVVEKFKAPIEKFRSIEDFQSWAEEECYKLCLNDFGGRTGQVRYKRESMICDWDQYLNNSNLSNSEKLLILKGITKDLKPNNENILPVYNRKILEKTLNELKTNLVQDKKLQFDFGKMYKKNLAEMYMEHSSVGKDESKWIIIPSKDNDPIHFKENVEKLQTLSPSEWCTKYTGADFHLSNGDFHIYIEKGKPKVALRLNDGLVQEINGEHNDFSIPKEYVKLTKDYLLENELITTEKANEILLKSEFDDIKKEKEVVKDNINNKQNKNRFICFIKRLFGIED